MSRSRAIALLIAWVSLVGVVAWSAQQTQALVADTNALVQTVEADILDTEERVCGSWLGTYQFLNIWAAEALSPEAARAAQVRFTADFKEKCPDYTQTMP